MYFLIGLCLGLIIGVLVMGVVKSGQMSDIMAFNIHLKRELERLAGGKI